MAEADGNELCSWRTSRSGELDRIISWLGEERGKSQFDGAVSKSGGERRGGREKATINGGWRTKGWNEFARLPLLFLPPHRGLASPVVLSSPRPSRVRPPVVVHRDFIASLPPSAIGTTSAPQQPGGRPGEYKKRRRRDFFIGALLSYFVIALLLVVFTVCLPVMRGRRC